MLDIPDFNKAVELYSDKLYAYMLRLVNNKDEAKDWTQEAFTILWEHRNSCDPSKVKSFLFTTAYRKMIDNYRRNKVHEGYTRTLNTGTQTIDKSFENRQLINLAFAELSVQQRSIVMLRDQEGYDYQSIADVAGMSMANVKINLFRARKQMKVVLAKLMNEREVKNG